MTTPTTSTPLWQRFVLIIGGTAFAIVMVLLLLYLFPNIVGNDPLARGEANSSLDVEFWLTDGDYFFLQPGRIRPPENNELLASYTLVWDDDGFRVPTMQADSYPIVAFGDSFTEGTTVALPWTDVLASDLNIPVQNFGYRGYGPLEITTIAQNYMGDDERSWVLYAHFSGNDLADANRGIDDVLMNRDPFDQVAWLTRNVVAGTRAQVVESPDGQYDYPMPMIIGGSYYEIAFLEDLLWWQVAPDEGFLDTRTFDMVGDALNAVAEEAPVEACRAVIFVPSKEQIYYPYIHEDVRQWIRGVARETQVTSNGTVILVDNPLNEADEATFIEHLGDQRDALQQVAEAEGWMFIDLLEPFQQAAYERGLAGEELLYYQYDGHWTQSGHQLASDVIAAFMRDNADTCPLELN